MTYSLKVESGDKMSDHGCNCKGTKDDVRAGVGERSRGQIMIATAKGTNNIQSGGGVGGQVPSGQITVATAKGPRMTYFLEVERAGKRSEHGCDCKGSREDILPAVGEGRQEVRSWL